MWFPCKFYICSLEICWQVSDKFKMALRWPERSSTRFDDMAQLPYVILRFHLWPPCCGYPTATMNYWGYALKSMSHKCDPHAFFSLLMSQIIMIVSTVAGLFMSSGSICSQIAHPKRCICSWTLNYIIGLNLLPSNSFMSNLYSLLGYCTGQLQALKINVSWYNDISFYLPIFSPQIMFYLGQESL